MCGRSLTSNLSGLLRHDLILLLDFFSGRRLRVYWCRCRGSNWRSRLWLDSLLRFLRFFLLFTVDRLWLWLLGGSIIDVIEKFINILLVNLWPIIFRLNISNTWTFCILPLLKAMTVRVFRSKAQMIQQVLPRYALAFAASDSNRLLLMLLKLYTVLEHIVALFQWTAVRLRFFWKRRFVFSRSLLLLF